jgi:iron complex outermembrane receptor protein
VGRGVFRIAGLFALAGLNPALAQPDLSGLSIEQLANVEITTVSRIAQPLSRTAAPVYVIGQDDIRNSGAFLLPDMLRLAPNLEVMQTAPSAYTVTSRGLNGNAAAQNFPNKLLVLIDGRSVYSPLFSGVYWDMQDVPAADIDHIEVVSGPGGTLWGANAVNGIVNIVTKGSANTQGGFVQLSAGDRFSGATLQYGGQVHDNLSYRFYFSDFYQRGFPTPAGGNAGDGWSKPQGGLRFDWDGGADHLTVQGDVFGGAEGQGANPNQHIAGGNLMARWNRDLGDGEALQVQAYYDRAERKTNDGGGLLLNTYDIQVQHNFTLGGWNHIVWGIGNRIEQYRLTPRVGAANSLLWSPPARVLNLTDLYAEDHVALSDEADLSVGVKLENEPYSGLAAMPSARLSWSFGQDLVWAAVSRAVRSPTPFDTDVQELSGSTLFLAGNPDFRPEEVVAYELGYRGILSDTFSYSVSLFDDVYSDLRNIEVTPTTVLPLFWGNGLRARIFGAEAWASWQLADWWRLSAGLTLQHEDFRFGPGATTLLGTSQLGNDPRHQANLRSTMRLADDLSFSTDLREVGALPSPRVPGYVEMNARLNWRMSGAVEVSVTGFNLLHSRHMEYDNGIQDLVPRSLVVETRWRF